MATGLPSRQTRKIYYVYCQAAGSLSSGNVKEGVPPREGPTRPITKASFEVLLTLKQTCLPEYQKAQCAFKDSMIH